MNKGGIIANDTALLGIIILVSRIPFLFAGYGSEEDAWGLILVARNISLSGVYEVSRLPGHPVQELFLSLVWNAPWWLINLMTAIISTTGVLYLVKTLRCMNIPNAVPAGIYMAFTPVYYVNSSNVMDYTWAVALVIIAFFHLHKRNIILAGLLVGIAAGFRVTAAAVVIPFAILLIYDDRAFRKIFILGVSTFTAAVICFLPPLITYGYEFFTYYEYFPYPPFLKNAYKGTIGAWGVAGFIALVLAIVASVLRYREIKFKLNSNMQLLLAGSLAAMVLFGYAFIRIPQKSAFIIPMIPFMAIIFAILLTKRQMMLLSITMIVSCFFAGIQLDDPIRGSARSVLSSGITIGNTPVVFDLLYGPVTADLSKRNRKIAYARNVVDSLASAEEKKIVIAGWWQNELKYFALKNPNPNVTYLYYADENELEKAGKKIFYLPEQDYYNDLRFRKTFTRSLAEPL